MRDGPDLGKCRTRDVVCAFGGVPANTGFGGSALATVYRRYDLRRGDSCLWLVRDWPIYRLVHRRCSTGCGIGEVLDVITCRSERTPETGAGVRAGRRGKNPNPGLPFATSAVLEGLHDGDFWCRPVTPNRPMAVRVARNLWTNLKPPHGWIQPCGGLCGLLDWPLGQGKGCRVRGGRLSKLGAAFGRPAPGGGRTQRRIPGPRRQPLRLWGLGIVLPAPPGSGP